MPEQWNSLRRRRVCERFRVEATEPEVVGQEESQPRGLNDIGTPETEANERQENKGGECHAQKC